jgi:hypothetical protein
MHHLGRHDVEVRESPSAATEAVKPARAAEVGHVLLARSTFTAANDRLDGDEVAHLDVTDAGAHVDHMAGELVPEAHRSHLARERVRLVDRHRERAIGELVEIRAADTGGDDRNFHGARLDLGWSNVVQAHIAPAVVAHCSHLRSSV